MKREREEREGERENKRKEDRRGERERESQRERIHIFDDHFHTFRNFVQHLAQVFYSYTLIASMEILFIMQSYLQLRIFYIFCRTVKCFDTCITGVNPLPLQCCADSISMPGTVSVTTGRQYQIARLHASDKPDYRLNTYCK